MNSKLKKVISIAVIALTLSSCFGSARVAKAVSDADPINHGAAAVGVEDGQGAAQDIVNQDAKCAVTSAKFDLGDPTLSAWLDDTHIVNYNIVHDADTDPNPLINSTFYKDGSVRPLVLLKIETVNCAAKKLLVTLRNSRQIFGISTPTDGSVSTLDRKSFVVPKNGNFEITMKAGLDGCSSTSAPDCRYAIRVEDADKDELYYTYSLTNNKPRGFLGYNFKNVNIVQLQSWSYISDTSDNDYNSIAHVENSGTTDECSGKDGCYQLYSGLSDVFGALGTKLTVLTKATSLGSFLNAIIAIIIAVAGVIAVLRIMYLGVVYMRTDNVSSKLTVRGAIIQTVGGFILLLLIYTILRTINPDLLNLTPRFDAVSLNGAASLTPDQFQNITGEKLGTASDYDALAKQAAQNNGIEYCALRTIIQKESAGNANIIGQDENAPFAGVPSRVAFINSGKKYSGAAFSPSTDLVTKNSFCNDTTKNCSGQAPAPSSPTLGLDWRFSKGIGLTQITFYPAGYSGTFTAQEANKNVVPSRVFHFSSGDKTYTAFDVFKPEINLDVAAKLWKDGLAKCSTPSGAFYTYVCGACSCGTNAFAQNAVSERMTIYNQCKAQNP
ncbi:MAG: hypothetical protein JWM20_703 [Patescibacteria group bacterium]|nr:hypothetical protein [Patescibacteria group bacterium]